MRSQNSKRIEYSMLLVENFFLFHNFLSSSLNQTTTKTDKDSANTHHRYLSESMKMAYLFVCLFFVRIIYDISHFFKLRISTKKNSTTFEFQFKFSIRRQKKWPKKNKTKQNQMN